MIRKFLRLPGVYFYERYVDDIVILASPTSNTYNAADLFKIIQDKFNAAGLKLHEKGDEGKFVASDISYTTTGKLEFDYLGYHVILDTNDAKVTYLLKPKKAEKYFSQINKAIAYYVQMATHIHVKTKKGKSGEPRQHAANSHLHVYINC